MDKEVTLTISADLLPKYDKTVNIINVKSVATLIEESRLPKWRIWLLRKLMPEGFYDIPAQDLGHLQKGSIVNSMVMTASHIDGINPFQPTKARGEHG